jgi:hypothetical protein
VSNIDHLTDLVNRSSTGCGRLTAADFQRLAGTEFAVVADQAGFDRAAAYQLDNARDDARMREVAFSIR